MVQSFSHDIPFILPFPILFPLLPGKSWAKTCSHYFQMASPLISLSFSKCFSWFSRIVPILFPWSLYGPLTWIVQSFLMTPIHPPIISPWFWDSVSKSNISFHILAPCPTHSLSPYPSIFPGFSHHFSILPVIFPGFPQSFSHHFPTIFPSFSHIFPSFLPACLPSSARGHWPLALALLSHGAGADVVSFNAALASPGYPWQQATNGESHGESHGTLGHFVDVDGDISN